jgi:hypothetical protein
VALQLPVFWLLAAAVAVAIHLVAKLVVRVAQVVFSVQTL